MYGSDSSLGKEEGDAEEPCYAGALSSILSGGIISKSTALEYNN